MFGSSDADECTGNGNVKGGARAREGEGNAVQDKGRDRPDCTIDGSSTEGSSNETDRGGGAGEETAPRLPCSAGCVEGVTGCAGGVLVRLGAGDFPCSSCNGVTS